MRPNRVYFCCWSMKSSKAAKEGETILRLPIDALKADPKNPRKLSDEARVGLDISLETFGPLDIVFNDTTGELVSGHQRVATLRIAGASEVARVGDLGHIVHPKTGDRFPVRFVRWDETKQRMANLVANNPHLQGEFTEDAIEQARALENEVNFHELQLDKLIAVEEAKASSDEGSEDQTGDLGDCWQIVVTCLSEGHQRALLERFDKEGLKCRALI